MHSRRRDAHRNHERLLAAAEAVLAERGADRASLEDVARRAGVGVGTAYRHFPDRRALLEGVLRGRLETLLRMALSQLDGPRPGEALVTWIRAFAAHAGTYRGLAGTMAATILDERSELAPLCHEVVEAGGRLLLRAQRTGEVRADVGTADLVTIVNAVAAAAEQTRGDPERADRFLGLVLDGLRSRPAAAFGGG